MRLVIILLLLLAVVSAKMYVIEFGYADGKLSADRVYVVDGTAPDHRLQPATGFSLKTFAADKELDAFKFSLPDIALYDDFSAAAPGGAKKLDTLTFAISSNYFPTADELRIYNAAGANVLTIDVSRFKETALKAAFKPEGPGIGGFAMPIAAVALVALAVFAYTKYKPKGEKRESAPVGNNWQSQMWNKP